jgi:guanosine-3',5'-bis(diphosphate) 3'-pyrophosphohydrolase
VVADIVEEKKEIIARYRRLLRKAKPVLKEGDARRIKRAFQLALSAHKDMRRKSGEPFIFHPLTVAEICAEEIGLGTTSIMAALIHDVVEDTEIELEEIEKLFGKKVARIVDGLTKIRGAFEYGSSAQAENFRKMLFTLSEDVRVILIKLADRLHNMRTLDSMPRNKQLKVANETIYLYAPLAHRLGLNAIKTELEDLYLRFTDRVVYDEIVTKIDESKASRNKFIKQFVQPVKDELDKLKIPYEIKGRPKSVFSIFNKMRRQNIPYEEVYDLFAIRIILDTPIEQEKSYCWQVYSIVTDYYTPNPDRLRDWISTPKTNGYESLHTTVMAKNGQWVEVQVRTLRMDEIAEKGYAAHWKYKDQSTANNHESNLEKWLVRVRELLERQDLTALEFVDDFRGNLFNEEIFVFTPRGELKTLPKGATALDFAFEIHTDIGAKCIGAKVNNKLVSINHILKNGDQIEILTSAKQKPTEDWLRFVVSPKAKSKIKDVLKEDKKTAAELGKETLLRKMKQLDLDPNSSIYEQMMAFFKVNSKFDLHYNFGKGIITLNDLKAFKEYKPSSTIKTRTHTPADAGVVEQELKKRESGSDTLLIGDDMDLVEYKLAKCCTPIPGDEVFGFVTVNEGIKIHRTNCPNATELFANHGHRVIKAKWTSQHQVAFLTGLKIVGTDRVGLINDVSKIISEELKVNMSSIAFNTDLGIFRGEIMLYVNDTRHLEMLIGKLEKVEGVVSVARFDSRNN